MSTTPTNIQILRSAVPYKRPDANFLLDGQLALNYKDPEPGLFTKLQNGDLIKIGPAAITSNSLAPNANPDAGGVSGNSEAEQWFDMRDTLHSGVMKTWDGAAWYANSGFTVDDLTGNFTLLKTLTVTHLVADSADIDGPLTVKGHLTPAGTQCLYDLGLAGERWRNFFACSADIDNLLAVGGGATIGGGLNVGGDISNNGNLDIIGSATFGQFCGQGKFTVKTPAFFSCDTEILGNVKGVSLDLSSNLTVLGDVTLGTGCGASSLTVNAETRFTCDVQFNVSPLTLKHIIVTDYIESNGNTKLGLSSASTLTVAATSTFNSIVELEGETRIGRTTSNALRTFGNNVFQRDLDCKANLLLVGKGYSAETVDSDLPNTMVTKQWAEDKFATDDSKWNRSGQTVLTKDANISIVPNGTAELGLATNKWDAVNTVVINTGDLHLQNERGDWTFIEEEDCLTVTNNKTGQRYALSMTPYAG